MYKLYNVKTWGSLSIHCLLEELEVPYTNIWMTPEQVRTAEFRAVSPLGMIPALGLPDGRTLFESAAIVSFLVTAHPVRPMSPVIGSPAHGEFLSLLHLMSTDIYGLGNVAFSAAGYLDDPAQQEALKRSVWEQVNRRWLMLDNRLSASGPWLMGREFSALDPYAFMLTLWGTPGEAELHGRFPAIAKLASAMRARPKLKAVLEAHGVMKVGGYQGQG